MVGKLYLITMAQCPKSENSCPAEKKQPACVEGWWEFQAASDSAVEEEVQPGH